MFIVELGTLFFINSESFVSMHQLLLLVICGTCVVLGIRERYVLNPYLCMLIFPFSLMIYDEHVSNYLIPLSRDMYPLCGCAAIAYMMGLHIFSSRIDTRWWFFERRHQSLSAEYFMLGILIFGVWAVFAFASLMHIHLPAWAIATQSVYVAIACFIKSKRRMGYFLVMIICSYLLIREFRKTTFLFLMFSILLSALSSVYITRKQMQKMFVIMAVCFFLVIFVAYPAKIYWTKYRSFQDFHSLDQLNEELELDSVNRGDLGGVFGTNEYILRPYLSFTTEWTNLTYVLDTQPERTNGKYFIRPFLNIAQMNPKWPELELEPYRGTYNTYTFLCWQIKDFGYFGAILLTFLEGLYGGWVYKRFRERPYSPFYVLLYLYVLMATLEMFFNNHFIHGGIHISIVVTTALSIVVKRMNPRLDECFRYSTNMLDRAKMGMKTSL